jgi:hypothetical protein
MLVVSSEKVWGMMAFAFIAFAMAVGGIFAALEAHRLTEEEPWQNIELKNIETLKMQAYDHITIKTAGDEN